MVMFIQNDATGAGAGTLDPNQAAVDLAIISNGDTGLGLSAQVGNRQQVTYIRTLGGPPPVRLDALVNTTFVPNYGGGTQQVDIVILPVQANFVLNDGTPITAAAGVALPPQNSGLPGAILNTSNDCLAIYDTSENNGDQYCTARNGTGGTLDLQMPMAVILYHELSHCWRIVNNNLQTLTANCNPSSPEENAAITDENDLRIQNANTTGTTVELRDPGIHCGQSCVGGGATPDCCIIASVASKSPLSAEVQLLRAIRDGFIRSTEVGFELFRRLFRDYYSFSPQICTVMAQKPELPSIVLNGYVQPLINSLQLLQAYALDKHSAIELGQYLAQKYENRQQAFEHLVMIQDIKTVVDGSQTIDDMAIREVSDLLQTNALTSKHVRWMLIEPVKIYGQALKVYAEGSSNHVVGTYISHAFEQWASEMPVDHIWASLTQSQLKREFDVLRDGLLRSSNARKHFCKRLAKKFGHITAINTILDQEIENWKVYHE